MRYALVSPLDVMDRLDSAVDPTVQTKPGWRWLPAPEVAPPAYSPDTEVLEGPFYTVMVDSVVQSWNVRAKTPEEMDATKTAEVDSMDRLVLKVLFDHENRIRVLEGKNTITVAQFKAALKAAL